MDTVRQGLRGGDLEKDTYERLTCTHCEERLQTRNDPEEIGSVRFCPECEREWKQIG
jgi:NAD-dependent SIR2 family protein deacetylase